MFTCVSIFVQHKMGLLVLNNNFATIYINKSFVCHGLLRNRQGLMHQPQIYVFAQSKVHEIFVFSQNKGIQIDGSRIHEIYVPRTTTDKTHFSYQANTRNIHATINTSRNIIYVSHIRKILNC